MQMVHLVTQKNQLIFSAHLELGRSLFNSIFFCENRAARDAK